MKEDVITAIILRAFNNVKIATAFDYVTNAIIGIVVLAYWVIEAMISDISSNIITLFVYSIISLCTYIYTRNNRKQRMSAMVILLPLFINTSYALNLDTIITNSGTAYAFYGNMFDICALREVEIQKMDVNCWTTDTTTIEIRVATSTNQGFNGVKNIAGSWTLVHSESVNCQPPGTLTVLSKFNQGVIV
eukprot:437003_1